MAELNKESPPLHSIFRSQVPDGGANDRFELSLGAIEQLTDYEATRPRRKLVVWIGSGWPLFDFQKFDGTEKNRQRIFSTIVGLSSRLRAAGITLDSVDPLGTSDSGGLRTVLYEKFLKNVNEPSQAQLGNLGLQVLALQSGGRVLTSSNDIAGEISACVNDANSFYVLSFEAAAGDGPNDYHSLEIKIDRPGVSARTRSGYYAQPVQTETRPAGSPALLEAAYQNTEAELVELVLTSLYSDNDDALLADRLHSIDLSEQLTSKTLGELQRLGVGPLAFAALESLRQKSASLNQSREAVITSQPAPREEYTSQMIASLVGYAREYIHNLPNFICDQVTKRYTNLDGFGPGGNPQFSGTLHYGDTMTVGLAFASGIEQERITLGPNQKMKSAKASQGQSISNGEFGRDMALILGVNVDPELKWDRWETFHGHPQAVFNYFVPLSKTEYSLFYCCFTKPFVGAIQQSYKAPVRGSMYVDPATGVISRLTIKAVALPATFHIKQNNTIVDCGKVNINGQDYMFPLTATVFVRADLQKNRNEVSFVRYRKFDPESVFTTVNSKITYKPVAPE